MDLRLSLTPNIAIVGRPNVGKSSLFNRLIGKRRAITAATPGTTTDFSFDHCHWRDLVLTVFDTAGLDFTSSGATEASLARQAKFAMDKADLTLFIVDTMTGLLPQDKALAAILRKSKRPVLLVANKADNQKLRRELHSPDWTKLGFGNPLPVSASNGSGVGDMLDVVVDDLKARGLDSKEIPEPDVRVAIIGRPNVGKSSLMNGLAGEDRVIVSEVPHTTKEPQDTMLTYTDPRRGPKNILVIDTVGIRKKARVAPGIEKLGVHMSLEEIERADLALLIIDASEGIGQQEKRLAGLIEEKSPALVIVVNKWDLAKEKSLGTAQDYAKYVAQEFPFLAWAPVFFISARSGRGVAKILDLGLGAAAQRDRELSQEELDAFTQKLKKIHHSAFMRGEKRPHVYGITQTGAKPPSFMVVVKDKETIHPNFLRFVENRLRDEFGFEGTPMRVRAREIS